MIKWLCILCRTIPCIISTLIKCKHMAKRKEKYNLETRTNVVKKMLHKIVKATRCKIEVEGKEYLVKDHDYGRVYFVNHNSVFDALVMFELTNNPLIFISKIENSKTPFLKTVCQALDVLMIDRSNLRQSLKVCKNAGLLCASEKKDIVIFPEGTRSKDGNVHEFKAAFGQIVHYSKAESIMVSMTNTRKPLCWRWFTYPQDVIKVKIFKPISYDFYMEHKADFNDHARNLMQSFVEENA